jgi:hypothetical protein
MYGAKPLNVPSTGPHPPLMLTFVNVAVASWVLSSAATARPAVHNE